MNDTWANREDHEKVEGSAWGVTWVIQAPWAHPAWSQYVLALFDLTSDTGNPPILYMPGATHEFQLYALDPNYPVSEADRPSAMIEQDRMRLLSPASHGYQFRAATNYHAADRIQAVVDMIVRHELSPDTDWRMNWDVLFRDGFNLRDF